VAKTRDALLSSDSQIEEVAAMDEGRGMTWDDITTKSKIYWRMWTNTMTLITEPGRLEVQVCTSIGGR
jgi:hypothetical protein